MRVLVAMSGGVDSSVAAALLQQRGYDVVGVTLRLYDCEEGQNERSCCGLAGVSEARAAAGRLGIPHYIVDGQSLFERRVLRYAWDEYADGRTPNPCVRCNEWMKFGLLYEQAKKHGARYLATGHHARILRPAVLDDRENGSPGEVILARGVDPQKDQSYFLFSLTPAQLEMSLLPIGELSKQEVRQIARALELPNAERLESQDACIAQQRGLAEALRRRFAAPSRSGAIRTQDGTVIGTHDGIHRFTVGQRKGLGLALGARAYVLSIDAASGDVVLGDEALLAARGLRATEVSWAGAPPSNGSTFEAGVQIRYRHRPVPAVIRRISGDKESNATGSEVLEVEFREPQRAVTPGQAVVLYDAERVLGGGWIAHAYHGFVPARRTRLLSLTTRSR